MRLKHIVKFNRGYDCIRFECAHGKESCRPGSGGSHGRHGLDILFVAKGPDGAVQFGLSTGWLPQYAKEDKIGWLNIDEWSRPGFSTYPYDLGYHSKKPHYEGQEPITQSCVYTDGGPCYYDGSTLNAALAMYTLVNGGDEALWKFLDKYYKRVFHDGESPEQFEYPFPERK